MMATRLSVPGDFDVIALWEAVDEQRRARDMSWHQVTKTLRWMSQDTIARMRTTGSSTCNHVLPMIQWVGRTPESFTVDPDGAVHELLPDPGERRWRWWWRHKDLVAQLEAHRNDLGLTHKQLAAELGVAKSPAAMMKRLRYGPPIGTAMIVTRRLRRSAASFLSEVPPLLQ
jgi:hypothetical protein